jgi:hypothetical protein
VEDARAKYGTHDAPHRRRDGRVFGIAGAHGPAYSKPDADERANGGEEPMPGELDKAEANKRRIDVDGYGGQQLHALCEEVFGGIHPTITVRQRGHNQTSAIWESA